MPTAYIYAAIGVAFLLMLGALGFQQWRVESLSEEMGAQKTRADTLGTEVTQLRVAKDTMVEQMAQNNAILDSVNTRLQDYRLESQKMAKKLAEHDVALLAARKPRLMEKRINDGTAAILKELEDLSRAQ